MKRLLVFLTALTLMVSIAGCGGEDSPDNPGSDYVTVVQNGYLGEYTDITVKNLLSGHYSLLYDKEAWDGGTTDSGKEIVEVKYQDSNGDWGDVTIQFTMLDEQCFQVTAFVDPVNPIEKSTDLLAALNYTYFEQYGFQHQEIVGDFDAELTFIQRLEQISGSAVLYGASADYSGNRGELCKLVNESPLEVNVPLLLDSYGLVDMSYYSAGSDPNEPISDPPIDNPPAPDTSKSDIIVETDYYTLTLPASWDGRYVCEQAGNFLWVFEMGNYNEGLGAGELFSMSLREDDEFLNFPDSYSLGSLVELPDSGVSPTFLYYIAVSVPTDVPSTEDNMTAYIEMSNDVDSIISSFTTKEGYAIIVD